MATNSDSRVETNVPQMEDAPVRTPGETFQVPERQGQEREFCQDGVYPEDQRNEETEVKGFKEVSAEGKIAPRERGHSAGVAAELCQKVSHPTDKDKLKGRYIRSKEGEAMGDTTDMDVVNLDVINLYVMNLDMAWSALMTFFLGSPEERPTTSPGRSTAARQLCGYSRGLETLLKILCVLLFMSMFEIGSKVVPFLGVLVVSLYFILDTHRFGRQFESRGTMFWVFQVTWALVPVMYAMYKWPEWSGLLHA